MPRQQLLDFCTFIKIKKMRKVLLYLLVLQVFDAHAQVKVGENPETIHTSAVLEIESENKGFLPPRLTTAERDAISTPAVGLSIFNTTTMCLQWYNGTGWFDACDGRLTAGPVSDCPFIPPYLSASQTGVVDVLNPTTGRTWMDRNLGAYNAARSATDCWAYGNLYQWGRAGDGHEFRGAPIYNGDSLGFATTALPNRGNAWDGLYITSVNPPFDWLETQDDNLWNSGTTSNPIKTANDPCPMGYRVPTIAELNAERLTWSPRTITGAFASPLKLSLAGRRNRALGDLVEVGERARYLSSTVDGANIRYLGVGNTSQTGDTEGNRAVGASVRCIKD
jgi:hypothetical protein